jgi:hypothetical protein
MAHRSSTYPLGKLLLELQQSSGLTPYRFVRAIGYKNSSKGINAFDGMLAGGYPNTTFLERLNNSPFAPAPQTLEAAVAETREILQNEEREAAIAKEQAERAAFRPYFQAVPELKSPTQITLFALTGGHSRYTHYLPPDFPTWPLVAQYALLEREVPAAYAKAEGRTLFMGRITGYRLFREYEGPSLLLSNDGKPLGLDSKEPIPQATLTIGKRALTSGETEQIFFSGTAKE